MTAPAGAPAIIYGGSFDPPHLGHEACLRRALDKLPNAKPFVIPAFQPPAGSGQIKLTTASYQQRLTMCRLAFQDLLSSHALVVDDIESRLSSPSFTLQTVQALKQEHQHQDWYLLIGADQLENLANWHEIHQLLALVNLIVIAREPWTGNVLIELLEKLASDLGLKLGHESASQYRFDQGTGILLCEESVSPAASRKLRQDKGGAGPWLDEKVARYIHEQGLYE